MTRRLDTADTLTRVFSLYAAQAGVLLPAALIIFLPVAILRGLISTGGAGVLLLLLASAVSLIGNVWYQGVVVEAVEDMQDGRRDFSIGELFRSAAPVLGTLLVAGILAGIGIAIGLILIIIPGLVLLTWWALLAPVIVVERKGVFEAFGRSRELVRGNGWRVFGVIVVVFLVQAVVSSALQAVGGAISDSFAGYGLGALVAQVVTAPLSALAAAVMFFALRGGTQPVPEPGPEAPPEAPAPA